METTKLKDHFVGAATVGERGQVVIPAEARERLGIAAGDKLLVFAHPHGWGVLFAKLEAMMEVQEDFSLVVRQAAELAAEAEVTEAAGGGEGA